MARRLHSDKDIAKLVKVAESAGFEFSFTKGEHCKLVRGREVIFMSLTPGDTRALRNIRADLRRRGVPV